MKINRSMSFDKNSGGPVRSGLHRKGTALEILESRDSRIRNSEGCPRDSPRLEFRGRLSKVSLHVSLTLRVRLRELPT
eukprot:7536528-Pyramimonas_sp.AAC.1